VQKIENGLKDSEEGKTISEDELDQEVQKWFE
jgi:predicted transcriptional regulator